MLKVTKMNKNKYPLVFPQRYLIMYKAAITKP